MAAMSGTRTLRRDLTDNLIEELHLYRQLVEAGPLSDRDPGDRENRAARGLQLEIVALHLGALVKLEGLRHAAAQKFTEGLVSTKAEALRLLEVFPA